MVLEKERLERCCRVAQMSIASICSLRMVREEGSLIHSVCFIHISGRGLYPMVERHRMCYCPARHQINCYIKRERGYEGASMTVDCKRDLDTVIHLGSML